MKFIRVIKANAAYLLLGAATLGLGFALGTSTAKAPVEPDDSIGPLEPAGNMGVLSVLPTTRVEWTLHFMACGHKVSAQRPDDIVGLTLSDITNRYPGARVTAMRQDLVAIELRVEEYCPEHYLLIATQEDSLGVFRTSLETLTCDQVMEIESAMAGYPREVQYALLDGVTFTSLEEINAYLEDIES